MEIEWKIRELRKEKNLTLSELEKLSGTFVTNISYIERGITKRPAFIDILKISKGLKVDIKDLYEEIEK